MRTVAKVPRRLTGTGTRKGRPRKDATGTATTTGGCVWPVEEGTCRAGMKAGLAVCAEHAKVLVSGAGKECAWPSCSQYAAYQACCSYHDKCARGLIQPR